MQDQIETFGMLLIKGVIAPALAALLAWMSVQVSLWIKNRVHNERIASVLDRLSQLAFTVVQEIQQTVVSNLSDKANKTALAAARDQAIATLKSHLGDKGLQELMTALGLKDDAAVTRLLVSYVESSVKSMKDSGTSAPSVTAILQPGLPMPGAGNEPVKTATQGTTP